MLKSPPQIRKQNPEYYRLRAQGPLTLHAVRWAKSRLTPKRINSAWRRR